MRICLLLLSLALFGCPSDTTDDDDATTDDDDSAADDDDAVDDDDAASCSAGPPPYAVDVTGGATATISFDDLSCTPYGGDAWSISFATGDSAWNLRLATGILVEGEETSAGNSVSLRNPGEGFEFTSGQTAAVVTIDVEAYADAPCGTFTVGALGDNAGGTAEIGPQPIGFDCR